MGGGQQLQPEQKAPGRRGEHSAGRWQGQAKGSGLAGFKLSSDVAGLAPLEDPVALVKIMGWRDEAGGWRPMRWRLDRHLGN